MVRSDVSMLRRIMQPLQSMFGLTLPTQANDRANQIDHETEASSFFFLTMSRVPQRPLPNVM